MKSTGRSTNCDPEQANILSTKSPPIRTSMSATYGFSRILLNGRRLVFGLRLSRSFLAGLVARSFRVIAGRSRVMECDKLIMDNAMLVL